jgi:hypothetical protein
MGSVIMRFYCNCYRLRSGASSDDLSGLCCHAACVVETSVSDIILPLSSAWDFYSEDGSSIFLLNVRIQTTQCNNPEDHNN